MKTNEMFSTALQLILVCSSCWMLEGEQNVVSESFSRSTKGDSLVGAWLLEEREALFPGDFLTPYRYDSDTPRDPHARGRRREVGGDACEPMVQGEGLDVEVANVSRVPATGFEWKRFAEDVEFERTILGSVVFVSNPLHTVSVLEPFTRGTCSGEWGAVRSRVTETVQRRRHGCKVAMNAGFFVPRSGKCLGNIISDGTLVRTAGNVRNANFGLRSDGTFVVGYLSDEEVRSSANPFRQVVTGVVWLVRNGTSFVNQSLGEECANNEETGTMKTFAEVLSARSAVGHDKEGRLVLAKVEGESLKRGADLYEFADLLIKHGVVNAINLDGGGSSQLVMGDTLVSYPSDGCPFHSDYRCEREVSTILCVHDVECLHDCHEHGECVDGECTCQLPWSGPSCADLNCSVSNCSGHGQCLEGRCQCSTGWKGDLCDQPCTPHHYGPGCTKYCYCSWKKHAHCSEEGECLCDAGWKGFLCNTECEEGYFGLGCKERCSVNCTHGHCSPVDGSCVCVEGWSGQNCSIPIADPTSISSFANGSGNHSNAIPPQNPTTDNVSSTETIKCVPTAVSTSLPPEPSPSQDLGAASSSSPACECSRSGGPPSRTAATGSPQSPDCNAAAGIGSLLPRDTLIAVAVSIPVGTLLLHIAMCVGCHFVRSQLKKTRHKRIRTQREKSYYTRLKIEETDSDKA